jgi:Zn-dependent alcohol dehydrogenase
LETRGNRAKQSRRCRKITAVVVREKEQPFSIEELELEEPRAGEVLVHVAGR